MKKNAKKRTQEELTMNKKKKKYWKRNEHTKTITN